MTLKPLFSVKKHTHTPTISPHSHGGVTTGTGYTASVTETGTVEEDIGGAVM